MSADSATDAWAVGSRFLTSGREYSLVQHWDGSGWRTVKSPNPGAPYDTWMADIEAVAPSDVWAVGSFNGDGVETLAERWDGSAWVQKATANPGISNVLKSVSAASAQDIWAVGSYTLDEGEVELTLAQHWDGSTWSTVPTPNPDGDSSLSGLDAVTAISSDDVWAVGRDNGYKTLFEHWNGKQWTIVPTKGKVRTGNLASLAAVSADDVWAVGTRRDKTFTVHWDGDAWSVVKSPNGDGDTNHLNGVSAVSATDVWAVGRSGASPTGNGDGATLVEHWDGTRWRAVDSPNDEQFDNSLTDVSAISDTDVWAVGVSWSDWESWYKTLLHWDGHGW